MGKDENYFLPYQLSDDAVSAAEPFTAYFQA